MAHLPARLLCALLLSGCGFVPGSDGGATTTAKPATTAAPAPPPPAKPAPKPAAGPRDAKGVSLDKVLGTKNDFWILPPFAKLKEGMTPAEAGRVLRGAEKIDKFGFAEIKVTDVKGVASYYLSFLDDKGKKKLTFAAIRFDPRLTDEPFWNALADHLKRKLGSDVKDDGKKHLMWINNALTHITLSKGITHDGYEVEASLTK
jgi:hypothetical protein